MFLFLYVTHYYYFLVYTNRDVKNCSKLHCKYFYVLNTVVYKYKLNTYYDEQSN